MPFQGLPDGLYCLKRPSTMNALVDHFGILDVGNRIAHPHVNQGHPILIEMTPPRLKASYFQGPEIWTNLGLIRDETQAIHQVRILSKNPDYHWFENNCEHFARGVATGRRESKQIQGGVIAAGLATLVLMAIWPEQE